MTALAFRTRWHAGPPERPFTGAGPIGEQIEERNLIGDALGLYLEVVWDYSKAGDSRDALATKVVTSIDAGRPVI